MSVMSDIIYTKLMTVSGQLKLIKDSQMACYTVMWLYFFGGFLSLIIVPSIVFTQIEGKLVNGISLRTFQPMDAQS